MFCEYDHDKNIAIYLKRVSPMVPTETLNRTRTNIFNFPNELDFVRVHAFFLLITIIINGFENIKHVLNLMYLHNSW